MSRIIAVTPAGRRGYLELLAHYILDDQTITEWHLWDNCRAESDRQYIHELAKRSPKIKVVTLPLADGHLLSINRFYALCNEPDAFYIKMDDDLVWLPKGLGRSLLDKAKAERGRALWWSPLVINNANCTWMVKYFSKVSIKAQVTAQATCRVGWRSAPFAECLHNAFMGALRDGNVAAFHVPDRDISLSRFSINCIGFFGSDVIQSGADFCPHGVDDEEWISAVLPAKLDRPGRIVGDCVVAHFSFWTQERDLLKTRVIEDYYDIAGLRLTHRPTKKFVWRSSLKTVVLARFLGPPIPLSISVPQPDRDARATPEQPALAPAMTA